MLRQFIPPSSAMELPPPNVDQSRGNMVILSFSLVPGGTSRRSGVQEPALAEHFDDTLLESMALLLHASLVRREAQSGRMTEDAVDAMEHAQIKRLVDWLEQMRKTKEIRMGGLFPLLIAQKSSLA